MQLCGLALQGCTLAAPDCRARLRLTLLLALALLRHICISTTAILRPLAHLAPTVIEHNVALSKQPLRSGFQLVRCSWHSALPPIRLLANGILILASYKSGTLREAVYSTVHLCCAAQLSMLSGILAAGGLLGKHANWLTSAQLLRPKLSHAGAALKPYAAVLLAATSF